MRAAALFALTLVFAGRASAQQIDQRAFSVSLSEDYAAFTTCGTTPVSWLRTDIDAAELGSVQAHEEEHRRHMGEFPTCAAFYEWRNASWANQIETEARAFCAGARWDIRNSTHKDWITTLWWHARIFARYFDSSLWNATAALDAILANCNPL